MQKNFICRWGILPLWMLLTATVFFRPFIPIDETRYLSVAWEMWLRGDYWVPFLNGHTYSHKPPMLFWLFHIGWAIFGVNEWSPRLVGPFCALLNLLLIRQLAKKLWPEQSEIALLVPWVLMATLLWTLFATSAMFDILLTCNVLLGMLGLLELVQGAKYKACLYFAVAIGFGLLAKGPVIFLHLLPMAALIGFWHTAPINKMVSYVVTLFAALLMGVGIALLWAIPAAVDGGSAYANEIFWQQTADRTIASEIHSRPLFWYIQFLPLVLFPWLFWPRFWKNVLKMEFSIDKGLRFCWLWLLSGLVIFSLLPSKQIHYLLPILPAFALLTTRVLLKNAQAANLSAELVLPTVFALVGIFLMLLPHVPGLSNLKWVQVIEIGWGVAILVIALIMVAVTVFWRQLSVISVSTALVVSVFVGFIYFFRYTGLAYDLRPAALQLQGLYARGIPCAFVGNYQGQLHFLGRLTQPLQTLTTSEVSEWTQQHADGFLLSVEKDKPSDAFYFQPHREYWLVFRRVVHSTNVNAL
ncbi:glycosyltransferase family 39 protein [Methylomonas sp. AM2-LC]|uniref:ArnT family glycosyltransferase n=1 Tax=Methylomonas sp. AM2-LC TaxID=3153301 RepID=UPI0032648AFE